MPRTNGSVYILVMRYHLRRGETNFTRCGKWIASAKPLHRADAEQQGFTYCRKCFGGEHG